MSPPSIGQSLMTRVKVLVLKAQEFHKPMAKLGSTMEIVNMPRRLGKKMEQNIGDKGNVAALPVESGRTGSWERRGWVGNPLKDLGSHMASS